MPMDMSIALIATAAVVGLLVGLTGVGAGAAMTPALIGFFGVAVPTAIATDLIFATITKTVGALVHGRAGQVNWRVATKMWAGSLPAVLLGSVFLVGLVGSGNTEWLTILLVALVGFTSWSLLKRAVLPTRDIAESSSQKAPNWLAPAGGAGLGLGVSMTSVGAGVLGMTLLVKISPAGTPPRALVATDLVHAIPIALVAGGNYWTAGLVDTSLLVELLIGSIPGVVLGARLSSYIRPRILHMILGLSLAAMTALLATRL